MNTLLDHPQRHAITTEEYFRMGEAGVFAPDARLELIEGEIIEMAPIYKLHAGTVNFLTRRFVEWMGAAAVVSVQNSLIVGKRSVPQPDIAVLKAREDAYCGKDADADDVLLVIEVSDSTLNFDLRTKAPLYARAGIAEYWVIDAARRSVHVHRDPVGGGYASIASRRGDDVIELVARPSLRITAAELFPTRR